MIWNIKNREIITWGKKYALAIQVRSETAEKSEAIVASAVDKIVWSSAMSAKDTENALYKQTGQELDSLERTRIRLCLHKHENKPPAAQHLAFGILSGSWCRPRLEGFLEAVGFRTDNVELIPAPAGRGQSVQLRNAHG